MTEDELKALVIEVAELATKLSEEIKALRGMLGILTEEMIRLTKHIERHTLL